MSIGISILIKMAMIGTISIQIRYMINAKYRILMPLLVSVSMVMNGYIVKMNTNGKMQTQLQTHYII